MSSSVPAWFLGLQKPLELHSVEGRGVPRQERIYLKVHRQVQLSEYFLLAGFHISGTERAVPLVDHALWLGAHTLDPGYWVVVYTGPGTTVSTRLRDTGEPALVLHWNRAFTVFHDGQVIPLLVRIDPTQVQLGKPQV